MKISPQPLVSAGPSRPGSRLAAWLARAAFSLIEIMITVALLSLIILGLLAMFTQTKRAFMSSMAQVDVLETGRAVVEMIARDLEQMTPSHVPGLNNNNYLSTNFFVELSPWFRRSPLLQGLPGTTYRGQPGTQDQRTNIVERFFFLTQVNRDWIGTGYEVLPVDGNTGGVGTLYRVTAKANSRNAATLLSSNFLYAVRPNAPITNFNRIASGIVHLQLRAFAANGRPITHNGFLHTPDPGGPFSYLTNTFCYELAFDTVRVPNQHVYYFVSNAVPAYLELELGILEPKVVERFKAMSGPGSRSAQLDYLSNRVAQVHLFRHRIPIRNVDYAVYR